MIRKIPEGLNEVSFDCQTTKVLIDKLFSVNLRVRSFGVIRMRITDSRSLRSWCIKETDESTLVTDSSVPLINYDPSDLGIIDPDPDNPKGAHPKSPTTKCLANNVQITQLSNN